MTSLSIAKRKDTIWVIIYNVKKRKKGNQGSTLSNVVVAKEKVGITNIFSVRISNLGYIWILEAKSFIICLLIGIRLVPTNLYMLRKFLWGIMSLVMF